MVTTSDGRVTAVPVCAVAATPLAFVTSNVVVVVTAVTKNDPLLPALLIPVMVTYWPTVNPCAADVVYRHVVPETSATVVTVAVPPVVTLLAVPYAGHARSLVPTIRTPCVLTMPCW